MHFFKITHKMDSKVDSKVKLPQKGARNILITSALPYVNNVPHLGNIIGCVLSADVYSRYCQLMKYNSIYVCGTDEYGTTTEMKAIQEGLTEQQICDKYHKIHAEIYKWFNIDFDYFGRTTTPQQTEIAQDIFKKAKKNGFIIEKKTQQLYDTKLQKFLADRYVEGKCPKCGYSKARGDQCDECQNIDYNIVDLKNPVSVLTGETPEVRTSKHLYLDLPKLKQRLDNFVASSIKKGVWSLNAIRETNSWINNRGLIPRCITRDLQWGTPVPENGYEDKVFYVWFDAPIGYISITANYAKDWQLWWKPSEEKNVELVQFMGKDNIPFHTVIFPCSILATSDSYTMMHSISVCEYLQYEGGEKFSKSRGTGVFGNHAAETGIPAEVWRYYLLSIRPETSDSVFTWDGLQSRNNNELIKNFGNFINRSISMVNKNGSVVHLYQRTTRDEPFIKDVNLLIKAYIEYFEKGIAIRDALRTVMDISRRGNKFLQDEQPWVLKKTDPNRMHSVLSLSLSLVSLLASLVRPFMPSISDRICEQLKIPVCYLKIPGEFVKGKFQAAFANKSPFSDGHRIGIAQILFNPIKTESLDSWRKAYSGR